MAENQLPIEIVVEVNKASADQASSVLYSDLKKKAETEGRKIGDSLVKAISVGVGNKNLMAAVSSGSEDAIRKLGLLQTQAEKMNAVFDRQHSIFGRVNERLRGIALLTTELTRAFFGLSVAVTAIGAGAIIGVKYLKGIEDASVGIAGTVMSLASTSGQVLSVADAFSVTDGIVKKLEKSSLMYNVSLRDTVDLFRAIVGAGTAAGMTFDQITRIATIGTVAVKSLGLDSRQVVQEVRDLVQGGIQPASSTLANALNIRDADIKRWKELGTLFQELENRLKGFAVVAAERVNTLGGAFDMLIRKTQLLFADKKVYSAAIEAIKEISDAIAEVEYDSDNTVVGIKFTDEAISAAREYGKIIAEIITVAGKLIGVMLKVGEVVAANLGVVSAGVIASIWPKAFATISTAAATHFTLVATTARTTLAAVATSFVITQSAGLGMFASISAGATTAFASIGAGLKSLWASIAPFIGRFLVILTLLEGIPKVYDALTRKFSDRNSTDILKYQKQYQKQSREFLQEERERLEDEIAGNGSNFASFTWNLDSITEAQNRIEAINKVLTEVKGKVFSEQDANTVSAGAKAIEATNKAFNESNPKARYDAEIKSLDERLRLGKESLAIQLRNKVITKETHDIESKSLEDKDVYLRDQAKKLLVDKAQVKEAKKDIQDFLAVQRDLYAAANNAIDSQLESGTINLAQAYEKRNQVALDHITVLKQTTKDKTELAKYDADLIKFQSANFEKFVADYTKSADKLKGMVQSILPEDTSEVGKINKQIAELTKEYDNYASGLTKAKSELESFSNSSKPLTEAQIAQKATLEALIAKYPELSDKYNEAKKYAELFLKPLAAINDELGRAEKELGLQKDLIDLEAIKNGGTELDNFIAKQKTYGVLQEELRVKVKALTQAEQHLQDVRREFGEDSTNFKSAADKVNDLRKGVIGAQKAVAGLANETDRTFGAGAKRALKNYEKSLGDVATSAEQLFTKAFKSIEDALVDAFMGAKVDIKAIFKSLLADIVRMFVRQQIMVPIVGVFQGTQGSPQGATGTAGGGGIFGGFNSFGGGTFGSSSVTDMIGNVATMTGNGAWGAGFANGMSGVSDAIAAYNSAASTAAQAGNVAQAEEFAKVATDLTKGADAAGSTLGQFAKSAGEYLPYLDAGLKLFQGDIKGAATSAAGTYIGMQIGGPIGAVIGSFIGSSLTKSIFGGDWENKGSSRIEGSFGGEGFEGYFAQTQKKDGGWFGSDKERTEKSPIGEELNTALDDAYKSIQSTLINLATNVGDTTAKSIIDSFTYTVKENIDSNNPTEALEKVINNMADSMTRSIVPSFDALVKKGESASAASSRLVGQLIAVKGAAESFANTNFSGTVDQLVVLSNGLVTMMGGLENFNASSQYYYENFYTEEEKLANTAIKVEEVFSSLNLTLPTTKNGFRDIIKSLDLTTASGQFTYAALMKVAPAFVELTKAIDDAAAAAQATQASLLDKYNPMDTVAEAVAAFENEGINIGHVLNMTADQLRNFAANAISAVDPTTEAGQRLLATFQKLAPAFDLIVEKADAMKKIVATMEGTLYNQADPAVAAKNIASRTNLSQSDLLSMTKEELQSTYNSIIGNAVTKIKEIKTTITASDIKSAILGVGDTVIDSIGKGEIESLSEILDTYTNKANEALTKMGVSQEAAANIIATAVGIITSMSGTGVPDTEINSVIGNAVSGINDIVNTVIVSESESFTDLKSEFDVLIGNFDKTTESTKDAADAASDLADRMKELQSSLKQTIQDVLSNYGGSNTLTSAFAFNQLESDITSLNGALGTAQITVTNLAKVLMGDLSTATVDQLEMYQNATTSFNNYISAIKTELEAANQELDKLKQLRDSYTSFGTKILRDIATANNQSIVPLISSEISKLESAIVSALPEDAITMAEELRGLYQELFNEENRLAEEQKANYERSIEFAKSIRGYLDKIRISEQSPASLEDRLKEAANQFSTTLTKSIAGDAEAQQALTGISDTYLGLAKDYFASTEGYADIFNQVVTGLEGIEGVKSIGELTYDETTEIKANTAEFVKKLEWLNGLMSTNSAKVDTQITTAQQQVTYLQGIFDALGANGAIVQAINSLLANYGTKAQELAVTVSYNGTSHKVSGGSKEDLVLAAVSSINPGFDYAGAAASNPALIEAWGKDLGIPGYAKGGMANGWSIVGERGPEVVNFAQPTRVYTNEQTQGMFAPVAANENDEEYLKAVIAELQALIRQNGAGTQAVIEELQQVKAELEEIRSKTRMKDAA